MGNKSSKDKTEKKLKQKKKKGHFKVLTLGISGSGKSTFAKQMKILYCGGFTPEEVNTYKDILLKNAMIGMQELVKQAEKLEYKIAEENRKRARFFLEMNAFETEWTPNIAKKLRGLWTDPAIQQTWSVAPEYQLQMSMMDYHMNNLDRYSAEGFHPTDEDMLRARQRTTGMQEITFDIESYSWTMIDVGGQKPERAKWEGVLDTEGVTAVIFFAALDEYNMASAEENGKTKMQIALETFEDMAENAKTKDLTVLLFLNKSDVFRRKIQNQKDYDAFQKTFPKYNGGQDMDKAAQHIIQQFQFKFNEYRPKDELYVHVTCALDTDGMDKVFKAVKETLFMNRMIASGVKM